MKYDCRLWMTYGKERQPSKTPVTTQRMTSRPYSTVSARMYYMWHLTRPLTACQ